MKPRIKEFHSDALGIFLWFLRVAWNPLTRKKWTKEATEVLKKMRQFRCSHVSFFMWLSDGKAEHVPLNNRTPYKRKLGKFDLETWNDRYWKLFRIFIKCCKDANIIPIPCVLMDRYCYLPYDKNKQGVSDFWSQEVRPYHVLLMDKTVGEIMTVYNALYEPTIEPINEAAHWGNHPKFHIIGQWFVDMWEKSLKKHTRLEKYVIDASHCEAGLGEFDKPKPCHVCGRPMGNAAYLTPSGKRRILPEYHGYSIRQNLTPAKWEPFINSAWEIAKFSEDCGGGPEALGYSVGGFTVGTAEQNKDMLKKMWRESKNKGKKAVWGLFPMESLYIDPKKRWIEDYSMDRLNDTMVWERYKKAREAWVGIHE